MKLYKIFVANYAEVYSNENSAYTCIHMHTRFFNYGVFHCKTSKVTMSLKISECELPETEVRLVIRSYYKHLTLLSSMVIN